MLKKILLIGVILTATVSIIWTVTPAAGGVDHLESWYSGYNEKYFNNELPKSVLITHDLHDDRFVALTEEYKSGYYHITFNPKFNRSENAELFTLLHEMCHIRQATSDESDEFDDHGPRWESCMHELADRKAFDTLW